MRLALCLEYPVSLRGGVSVLVESLAEQFVRDGHGIVLVSPDDFRSLERSRIAPLIAAHVPWNPANPTRRQGRSLTEQLIASKVDLAHFHLGGVFGWGIRIPGASPIVQLARRGVPCVTTSHLVVSLLDGYCGPQKPRWFKLALLPMGWCGKLQQLRAVQAEIAVSQHDLAKLQRWYAPARERFTQIYHSVLSGPAPDAVAREETILNVGHVAWRKGQVFLTEAFVQVAEQFPRWKLVLAGHDSGDGAWQQIEKLVHQHGLQDRVKLLGAHSQPIELMQRAGIYVQPSSQEALGLALQEALWCGCPGIGTRIGGIPELIRTDETGALVDYGDVPALAAALTQLMADPDRRQRWGKAAAADIVRRGMNAETMYQRHRELYERILSER